MIRGFFQRAPDIWEGATFLRKWGLIGVLIGIGAGVGALALIWLIHLLNHLLLGGIVGYLPPLPGGEGGSSDYVFHMARPWLLPLVTGGVGRLCGRITLLAAHRVPEERRPFTAVREAMSREWDVAFPDEDLFAILKRFAAKDVGNLLVVARKNPECPVGLISRSGLWSALEAAKQEASDRKIEAET